MNTMYCLSNDPQNRLFSPYQRFSELTTEELHFALRIVQRELEKKLKTVLTDDEFMDLFLSIKKEHFLHPAGSWSGVTMRNVYNGPFIRRAKERNDEIVLSRAKSCWYIAKESFVCHEFFKEHLTKEI